MPLHVKSPNKKFAVRLPSSSPLIFAANFALISGSILAPMQAMRKSSCFPRADRKGIPAVPRESLFTVHLQLALFEVDRFVHPDHPTTAPQPYTDLDAQTRVCARTRTHARTHTHRGRPQILTGTATTLKRGRWR